MRASLPAWERLELGSVGLAACLRDAASATVSALVRILYIDNPRTVYLLTYLVTCLIRASV